MTNIEQNLDQLLAVVSDADAAIMEIYNANSAVVEWKADNTPLTQADKASHEIISRGLEYLFPDIPVVSEEGDELENEKNVRSDLFWLVDPIDGTKEFLARTGQFCICLALIKEGMPIFGIVSAPAVDTLYYGGKNMGSFRVDAANAVTPIRISESPVGVVLGSRTELDGPTVEYITKHYPNAKVEQIGAQLKLPRIAEGLADAYPRINGPLHLWDLAPGQAVLEAAGGIVTRPDGGVIDYRDPSLMAGDFVARSKDF